MHHGKKVNYSASCLSALTATVICVMVAVKVSKKTVLEARALSDSHRFCAIAIYTMIACLVIIFTHTVKVYQVLNHCLLEVDTLVELMLLTYLR